MSEESNPKLEGNKSDSLERRDFNDISLEEQKELIALIHQKQENGEALNPEEETILNAHYATVDMAEDIKPKEGLKPQERVEGGLDIVETSQ